MTAHSQVGSATVIDRGSIHAATQMTSPSKIGTAYGHPHPGRPASHRRAVAQAASDPRSASSATMTTTASQWRMAQAVPPAGVIAGRAPWVPRPLDPRSRAARPPCCA
jgi:hypothetical protein